MKLFTGIIISTAILFSGCGGLPTPAPKVETIYVGGDCPLFTKTLNISIKRLDDDYAKITWSDVQKLKDFGAAKEVFNNSVKEINTNNRKNLNISLEKNK